MAWRSYLGIVYPGATSGLILRARLCSLRQVKPIRSRSNITRTGGGSSVSLGWNAPGLNTAFNQATQLAQASNAAIVFASTNEAEGSDRNSLLIPDAQEQLIEAVVQSNPHTTVVLNTGGPVLMPWVKQSQAIVEAWYPGQEDGNAIAAILFGDVNPSGKLPMTFPVNANNVPANTPVQYPGINEQAQYSEGMLVGYRHYDTAKITPLFPFGYGLSYTTFSYNNLTVSPGSASSTSTITVGVDVTNTGSRADAQCCIYGPFALCRDVLDQGRTAHLQRQAQ